MIAIHEQRIALNIHDKNILEGRAELWRLRYLRQLYPIERLLSNSNFTDISDRWVSPGIGP